jgi:hypothetical protein
MMETTPRLRSRDYSLITEPQIDYLDALCDKLGRPSLDCEQWTRRRASEMIDKLKAELEQEDD